MTELSVTEWLEFMRINRSALAAKLGVSRHAIYNWERANRIPDRHREFFQGRWVGKTPDSLFESEDT